MRARLAALVVLAALAAASATRPLHALEGADLKVGPSTDRGGPSVQTAPAQTPSESALRLRAYHDLIAAEAGRLPARASLAALVGPLFGLAAERSATGPAAEENRAALTALALYANDWRPEIVTPEAAQWPAAPRREIVLLGRQDLARHFALSAVVQASAGTALATLVGVIKELADARGGSGFSFPDLAADRAGAEFGARAGDASSAHRLQQLAAAGLTDRDLMPAVDALPEGLSAAEFKKRFEEVGSPAFAAMVEEIDRRIASLPLYRESRRRP